MNSPREGDYVGVQENGDGTRDAAGERAAVWPRVSIVIPTFRREEELKRLVRSIAASQYPTNKTEIIIVDDAASLHRRELPDQAFERLCLITNEREKLLSECRNQGLRAALNEYVFFIDDDNVIADDCTQNLVEKLRTEDDLGAVTPFQYYLDDPSRVWSGGILRNAVTSTTTIVYGDEREPGPRTPVEVDDAPNAFMVRRSVATGIGGFDSVDFPIEFEHSDFFARMNEAGYRLESVPDAVIYHDTPLNKTVQFGNPTKVYYRSRNRVLLQRRHAPPLESMLFLLLLPGIVVYYVWELYRTGYRDNLPVLLRGFFDGLFDRHTDKYHPPSS